MVTNKFYESHAEEAALAWLEQGGWTILHGPEIAYGEPGAERTDPGFRDVVLQGRLRDALARLNPGCPASGLEDAYRKLTVVDGPSLLERNRTAHRMLVDGISVEYQRKDGSIGGFPVRVFDFAHPENNDLAAVNQFTVYEGIQERRPDIVLFINGLPIAGVELKNPADEQADIWKAYDQFQTYKHQIPSLYVHNALLCISDGLAAKVGSITSEPERFQAWRTIAGEEVAPLTMPQLEVVIKGLFDKQRLLDFLRYFIAFEDEGGGHVMKKIAGYHQFHAVNQALETTRTAASAGGDGKAGIVWHTQGSGKSLTMIFYTGRLVQDPGFENPTVVVITDRNDLDDQLFGTFSRCHELLRQLPERAESREDLKGRLQRSGGGVVFTTIQKFFPEKLTQYPQLSDRRNIVVIADEAHRSQFDLVDGYARHMRDALPNASYIGFTGTPIESDDVSTRAIFGNTISVYDIQRAVEDKATVPIYYENRLAKLALKHEETPKIDSTFEEVTEGEEEEQRNRLATKWAAVEALVGSEKRLKVIAADLVRHYEERTGMNGTGGIEGKAMVVCMSRRICVDLYKEIVALRPQWHQESVDEGAIKVVMTGSATDPIEFHQHTAGNKERREKLAKRFKNAKDPLRIVLVRDMWLTGFDVPCLHTMYVDKYMQAHGLMQAIARVNRVFGEKPGGLVVDYLGIAPELEKALRTYTQSGGKGSAIAPDVGEAVELMLRLYAECCAIFRGFDWTPWRSGSPIKRLNMLAGAQEHVLQQQDGKERLAKAEKGLTRAFALANPHEEARRIVDDIAFFQAVRSALSKSITHDHPPRVDMDHAIRQIVSNAIASTDVIDIFAAAGLKKPDISILSDAFLGDIQRMPQKHLALELLRKMLNEEIKRTSEKNVVQSRKFSELLQSSLQKYQNRALEAAQVIEVLIDLARDMREAASRGERLGLNDDEVAFYDALGVNDSAVQVLGDASLKLIAKELVEKVRANVTIDWTSRESVRAHLRVIVRRILRKYGYPPDMQETATRTVLEQAEVLSEHWAKDEPQKYNC